MDIEAYIQSGIIESYVLGLTSAEEAAELENLQLQFPEVGKAISDFSLSVEQYAFDNAITPPGNIKAKVMAAVEIKETSTVVSPPSNAAHHSYVSAKRFQIFRVLAAASVILFIASTGLNFYLYQQYKQKNKDYQVLLSQRNTLEANNQLYQAHVREWRSAAEMMLDSSMAMIKMKGTPGREQHFATLFWDTKNKDVYIMPNQLPHPAKGKQFQLWALVGGKPVDAGVLDPHCESVCKMKNIQHAEAFAITLENEGGSAVPTMDEMYVMGKV